MALSQWWSLCVFEVTLLGFIMECEVQFPNLQQLIGVKQTLVSSLSNLSVEFGLIVYCPVVTIRHISTRTLLLLKAIMQLILPNPSLFPIFQSRLHLHHHSRLLVSGISHPWSWVIDSPNNTIARCGDLTPTPVIHRAKADTMRHFFQVKSRHVIGELRAWDNTSEPDSMEAYMTPSAMIFGTLCGFGCCW